MSRYTLLPDGNTPDSPRFEMKVHSPESDEASAPVEEERPSGWTAHRQRSLGLVALAAVALVASLTSASGVRDPSTRPDGVLAKFECNPFDHLGRLQVDLTNLSGNVWAPWDAHCAPSTYLNSIARDSTTQKHLEWLVDRTILLQGDSIDRNHLGDFCDFVGGRQFNVGTDHPALPPPHRTPHTPVLGPDGKETTESIEAYRLRRENEDRWEARGEQWTQMANPWVCDIQAYGATLINVFTWGLQPDEVLFGEEPWYHPPGTTVHADSLRRVTLC